ATAAAAATAVTSSALAVAAGSSPLDALTPAAATALAERLPLRVVRSWNANAAILGLGAKHDGANTAGGGSSGNSGSGGDQVAVRVVGLHWYDSDALGVVLLLGLSMRLVVVDLELNIREL
ncbi:hypothetical protein Agub_g3818, partial [Astrephomene gubernaculifera]